MKISARDGRFDRIEPRGCACDALTSLMFGNVCSSGEVCWSGSERFYLCGCWCVGVKCGRLERGRSRHVCQIFMQRGDIIRHML